MTYAAHSTDFPRYASDTTQARHAASANKRGILRRLVEGFTASRRRAADREIARFLARSGGRFSDDLERELMHRVTTRDWNVHR